MNLRLSECVYVSHVCVQVCVGSVQASDKIKAQPMLKSHSFRTPPRTLHLGFPDCNLIRFVAWPALSAYPQDRRLHRECLGTLAPYANGLQYYPVANALRFSAV